MRMRVALCFLFIAGLTATAQADRNAADECAASLPPAAKHIYDGTMASHPTAETGRSIVIRIVEKMIADGKLTLFEGKAAGEAAGTCLKKMAA
jgi:hypothetical protein